MSEKRVAILIGNGTFIYNPDPKNLRCPENDVSGLARIFRDSSKGAFDEVIELIDRDAQLIKKELYRKLNKAEQDDLVVVYYSGHGKLNKAGKLYLVTADTHPEELEPTSIAVSELIEYMRNSRCKKFGLILDCCYSGAITGGLLTKGDERVVDAQLRQISGNGVRVITASTAIQTAAELADDQNSLLTKHLIGGLTSGDADEAFTGRIVFSDLFHYARKRVIREGSQEPTITELDARDEFIISFGGRNSRKNRANIIGNKLAHLASNEIIPKNLLAEAIAVLEADVNVLTFTKKKLDNLLEEFHLEKISVSTLIFEWGRASDSGSGAPEITSQAGGIAGTHKIAIYKINPRDIQLCLRLTFILILSIIVTGIVTSTYRNWDDDQDRGAMPIQNGLFGESYQTPRYLDQGWSPSESLWFYNTTQGSNLLPSDFFLSLEQADSNILFNDPMIFDRYRFLPQKPTFFNPDGLAVGFVKDTFQDKSYIGFTCAACHTGQINYHGKSVRIDGGSSMADYEGYLTNLYLSLNQTQGNLEKKNRFIEKVLSLKHDYSSSLEIEKDLKTFTNKLLNDRRINHNDVDPGYARMDMLAHIYNKTTQLITPYDKLNRVLTLAKDANGNDLLTDDQISQVLKDIPITPLNDAHYGAVFARLESADSNYPHLNKKDILRISKGLFFAANAPVSVPALWDTTQSDFLMWDGRIRSAGNGPLASNVQQSAATFASINFDVHDNEFNLSAFLNGKSISDRSKLKLVSSIDQDNMIRLDAKLDSLNSPKWSADVFGPIDKSKAKRGKRIYANHCINCHDIVDRRSYGYKKTTMVNVDTIGTDPAVAMASSKAGFSGILEDSIQQVADGNKRLGQTESMSTLVVGATKVLLAAPDPDKSFLRNFYEYFSLLSLSFFREVSVSVINDTTASYKARPLNGIWSTAPYLHNGSVPSLYELLLPKKLPELQSGDEFRPDEFIVGSREFDPVKVGYKSSGYDGYKFSTSAYGNSNSGHLYGTALTDKERWELLEYLKEL